jgi:hypothetical protein
MELWAQSFRMWRKDHNFIYKNRGSSSKFQECEGKTKITYNNNGTLSSLVMHSPCWWNSLMTHSFWWTNLPNDALLFCDNAREILCPCHVHNFVTSLLNKTFKPPIPIDYWALDFVKIVVTCSKLNNHFEDKGHPHFHLFWWWGHVH